MNPEDRIAQFRAGLISEAECLSLLDAMEVQGGFSPSGFTGYDYRAQRWVVVEW